MNLSQPSAELSVTQLALAFFPRCCFGITSQSTYGPVPGNCTQGLQVACSGKGQNPFPRPPSMVLVCAAGTARAIRFKWRGMGLLAPVPLQVKEWSTL